MSQAALDFGARSLGQHFGGRGFQIIQADVTPNRFGNDRRLWKDPGCLQDRAVGAFVEIEMSHAEERRHSHEGPVLPCYFVERIRLGKQVASLANGMRELL